MNACFRLLLASLLCVAADVAAQRCQDVSTLDFRNGVIETQSAPEVLDPLQRVDLLIHWDCTVECVDHR